MHIRSTFLICVCIAVFVTVGSPRAADPVTKEVEVNGVVMPFVDQGTGDTILFVHGAVSDLRVWEPIRREVADKHRFIAITLRYFGTGDWPDKGEQFSVATHANDVAAFIKTLNVGPVHLIGWSYGANVATVAALQNPNLVKSLILFEPALSSLVKEGKLGEAAREAEGRMFGPVGDTVQQGDFEKATRLLIEGVFQMPPDGFENQPRELQAMQLDNARTMGLMWSAEELRVTCDMLRSFDRPTLIVHGAESNAYWTHVAQVMDECLSQGDVRVQPNVNHDGPVRDPAGFTSIVEDFVVKH